MRLAASVQELRKDYVLKGETVYALRGVTFDIPEGDYVAIMGPSGSGKSTLLNLLGCLDRPTSGQLFLGDDDVGQMSDDQLSHIRASRIGFVFQSYNLIAQLTVLENIEVPLYYMGRLGAPERERCHELAEMVGLSDRLKHRPVQLSGGQQQRVAIARSLVNDPYFILADEPTGNLDSVTADEILNLFHASQPRGSHDHHGHARRRSGSASPPNYPIARWQYSIRRTELGDSHATHSADRRGNGARFVASPVRAADELWVEYQGQAGPGLGKHIVLVSGDEEYRSEEALPMLGKILAVHHGFRCTVLFAVDPQTGLIDPINRDEHPGARAAGDGGYDGHRHSISRVARRTDAIHRPVCALGQADPGPEDGHARIQVQSRLEQPLRDLRLCQPAVAGRLRSAGLGRYLDQSPRPARARRARVESSTRRYQDHPILRGVRDIWGPTDVYSIRRSAGGRPGAGPRPGAERHGARRSTAGRREERSDDALALDQGFYRPFGQDRRASSARRWAPRSICRARVCGGPWSMRAIGAWAWRTQIPAASNVDIVGEYKPTFYGFGNFQRGVRPADLRTPEIAAACTANAEKLVFSQNSSDHRQRPVLRAW